MGLSLIFFVIAAVLAFIASFQPNAGQIHLGWAAVGFLALAHVVG